MDHLIWHKTKQIDQSFLYSKSEDQSVKKLNENNFLHSESIQQYYDGMQSYN